jgi:hypothetical protein
MHPGPTLHVQPAIDSVRIASPSAPSLPAANAPGFWPGAAPPSPRLSIRASTNLKSAQDNVYPGHSQRCSHSVLADCAVRSRVPDFPKACSATLLFWLLCSGQSSPKGARGYLCTFHKPTPRHSAPASLPVPGRLPGTLRCAPESPVVRVAQCVLPALLHLDLSLVQADFHA